MFVELESLLKTKVDEVAFFDIKPGKKIDVNGYALPEGVPVAMRVEDLVEQVRKGDDSGLKMSEIYEGMIKIVGIDGTFPHKAAYLKFIEAFDENAYMTTLTKALSFADQEDFLDALIYFKAANELLVDQIDVLYNYSKCLEAFAQKDQENYELLMNQAYDTLKYIIQVDENFALAHYHLGFHLTNKKQYQLADQHWQLAIKLGVGDEQRIEIVDKMKDNSARVTYEKGYQLVLGQRPEEGLEYLLSIEDEYNDWWNLMFFIGLAYRQLEKFDQALDYYQRVLNLNTGHIDTFNEIGLCYMSMNMLEDAKKYFREAIRLDQQNHELLCNLGIVYLYQDNLEDAEDVLLAAKDISPDDEIVNAWLKELNRVKNTKLN